MNCYIQGVNGKPLKVLKNFNSVKQKQSIIEAKPGEEFEIVLHSSRIINKMGGYQVQIFVDGRFCHSHFYNNLDNIVISGIRRSISKSCRSLIFQPFRFENAMLTEEAQSNDNGTIKVIVASCEGAKLSNELWVPPEIKETLETSEKDLIKLRKSLVTGFGEPLIVCRPIAAKVVGKSEILHYFIFYVLMK